MNSLWLADGGRNSWSWFTQNLHDIVAQPSQSLLSDYSLTQGWSWRMVMVVKTKLPIIKTLDIILFFFFGLKRETAWSEVLLWFMTMFVFIGQKLEKNKMERLIANRFRGAHRLCQIGMLIFLSGESYGQRILVGCSPWGRRVGHDWATNCLFIMLLLYVSPDS